MKTVINAYFFFTSVIVYLLSKCSNRSFSQNKYMPLSVNNYDDIKSVFMKPLYPAQFQFGYKPINGKTILPFLLTLLCAFNSMAQCPGSSSTATLKWDYRNYLVTTGNYSGFVTAAMSQSQNFSLGTNRVNIAMGGAVTTLGQNTSVTQTGGSFGSGNSVSYNGNGTVTLTFDTVVANLNFSLYDIDNGQSAAVTAKDASGNNLNITMARVSAGVLTIVGSGGTTPVATSLGSSVITADTKGTLNISINGFTPAGTKGVKTVTITTSLISDDFWLSDISACVYRSFATSYYQVSKPWTGQPAYTLATSNAATVSAVSLSTGNARFVVKDGGAPAANTWLNSFGYDPYNYKLYYTLDTPGSGNTGYAAIAKYKALKKYDFNTITTTMGTGTISTVIPDVTAAPFNIPVFDQALISGGGAYYDGCFYLGVEGTNSMKKIAGSRNNSGRYSMVWRIDFDATGNALQACQVFAMPADDGAGNVTHDWGDFIASNGILYDFNSAGGSATPSSNRFNNYNLQSGIITATFSPNGSPVPGQTAIDWNENIYWFHGLNDQLAPYNKAAGTIGSTTAVSGAASIDWTASGAGDAAEAFKPPIDYGDAPASYDNLSFVEPAGHDYDSLIHLGNTWNAEFAEKTSVNATGDGASDDGLGAAPPLLNFNGTLTYTINVNVYNHTGANATLAGWLDYNFNGKYDAGEGITVTVPSSTSPQIVPVTWTSIFVPSTALTNTFLRLRLTRTANGLTTSDMNGYKADGEVEDYSVVLGSALPVDILSFDARKKGEASAEIKWTVAGKLSELSRFEVERNSNNKDWVKIATVAENAVSTTASYTYLDKDLPGGQSYYRVKLISVDGAYKYSIVKSVYIAEVANAITIFPNPAKDKATVKFTATIPTLANLSLYDNMGKLLRVENFKTVSGNNEATLDNLGSLANGSYILRLQAGNTNTDVKLIINK